MAATYTVLSQQQTVGKLVDGTYGPVVRITFRTVGGSVRAVDIPVDGYNIDNVRAALEAEAEATDAIANL